MKDSKRAEDIYGWMSEKELQQLRQWASRSQVVIEVGCWHGRSTHAIAEACPGTVFVVDCFRDYLDLLDVTTDGAGAREAFLRNLKPFIDSGKLFLLDMDSKDGLQRLSELLKHRKADLAFIDGGHEYDVVSRDAELCRPLIRLGGILSGHDAFIPDVDRFLLDKMPGWKHAVDSIWYVE